MPSTILWDDSSGTWDDGAVSWGGEDLNVTTTGCDHLNEDGGLNVNEDNGIALLESCPTAETQVGSGPAISNRRGPYTDHNARKILLMREDEEMMVLI